MSEDPMLCGTPPAVPKLRIADPAFIFVAKQDYTKSIHEAVLECERTIFPSIQAPPELERQFAMYSMNTSEPGDTDEFVVYIIVAPNIRVEEMAKAAHSHQVRICKGALAVIDEGVSPIMGISAENVAAQILDPSIEINPRNTYLLVELPGPIPNDVSPVVPDFHKPPSESPMLEPLAVDRAPPGLTDSNRIGDCRQADGTSSPTVANPVPNRAGRPPLGILAPHGGTPETDG